MLQSKTAIILSFNPQKIFQTNCFIKNFQPFFPRISYKPIWNSPLRVIVPSTTSMNLRVFHWKIALPFRSRSLVKVRRPVGKLWDLEDGAFHEKVYIRGLIMIRGPTSPPQKKNPHFSYERSVFTISYIWRMGIP